MTFKPRWSTVKYRRSAPLSGLATCVESYFFYGYVGGDRLTLIISTEAGYYKHTPRAGGLGLLSLHIPASEMLRGARLRPQMAPAS